MMTTEDLEARANAFAKEKGIHPDIALAAGIRSCVRRGIKVVRPDELAKNKLPGDFEDTMTMDPRKKVA